MSKHRLAILLWSAVYYLLLQWSYASVESVVFHSIGFVYVQPPYAFQLLGFAMAMLPVLWLPTSLERPSAVCLWMFYIMLVAPLMFVPYHVIDRPPLEVLPLPLTILGLFALLAWTQTRRLMKLPRPRLDRKAVHLILLLTSIVLTGLVMSMAKKFDLSLDDVYERRFAAREIVQPRTMIAYAVTILSGSLGPILICLGYVRKRWDMLLIGVLGLVSVFSLSGAKTSFFMPLFLLAMFWLICGNRRYFGQKILMAACGLVFLSIFEFTQLDSFFLSNYFVRRELFIPSLLTSYYWDFFSDHSLVYYSDSFLRWLIPAQYDLPTARLIGEVRFHSFEANANANFWASAFANLGYTGMVLVTLCLGMLLRLLDSIARCGEFLVTSLVVSMCAITWSNGALETSMLSNGVALSIVILYFLRVPPPAHATDPSVGKKPLGLQQQPRLRQVQA